MSWAAKTARYCARERYAKARNAATELGFAAPVFAEMKSRVIVLHRTLTVLPPIDVVQTGCGYAVIDGHHRVSVARARGAITIDAVVAAG